MDRARSAGAPRRRLHEAIGRSAPGASRPRRPVPPPRHAASRLRLRPGRPPLPRAVRLGLPLGRRAPRARPLRRPPGRTAPRVPRRRLRRSPRRVGPQALPHPHALPRPRMLPRPRARPRLPVRLPLPWRRIRSLAASWIPARPDPWNPPAPVPPEAASRLPESPCSPPGSSVAPMPRLRALAWTVCRTRDPLPAGHRAAHNAPLRRGGCRPVRRRHTPAMINGRHGAQGIHGKCGSRWGCEAVASL